MTNARNIFADRTPEAICRRFAGRLDGMGWEVMQGDGMSLAGRLAGLTGEGSVKA